MTKDEKPDEYMRLYENKPSYLATLHHERAVRKRFSLDEGNFLSTEEVARVLGVKEEVIRDLIRKRELPAIKIGKAYRIFEEDLQVFLNDRYTPHLKKDVREEP
jgi:excisionase family DNA binding protein